MKTIKILLIAVTFYLLQQNLYAQEITELKKQQYITELSDSVKSYNAIQKVALYKIVEAIPTIIEQLWNKRSFEQILFLKALKSLNYGNTKELTYQYLSRVNNYHLTEVDLKLSELKGAAAELLIDLGDYSQNQLFYEDIKNDHPDEFPMQIFSLIKILNNYSPDREKVTQLLKEIVEENYNEINRIFALKQLYEHYGEELIPYVIERFEKDSANAMGILGDLLYENRGKTVHNYLQKIVLENLAERENEAGVLIRNWGTPTDLYIVRQVQAATTDESEKDFLEWKTNEDPFVQEHAQAISSKEELIDSLISYNAQCNTIGWLGNSDFSSQLSALLTEASSELSAGDSLGTAIKIKQYQSLINEEYKDSLDNDGKFVTSDGYKFLYYYPKYILERLPKLPTVKLEDSEGSLLPGGSLQYYESGWKDAINNSDGTFSLPVSLKTLSLKMTYAYGSQTKSNVTVGTDTVTFQTVNAVVKLLNSSGGVIDTGKVQYYSSGWREFGTTTNGVASKELLANNYTFRITYGFASNDKAQNIGATPTVVFQTVNTNVELRNSFGNLMDAGTVQYYSSGWREFGTTANGVATKELLANNYTFRMTYGFASNDKAQNIGTTPTVVFQTVNANVELRNSSGSLIDQGTVQYYSSGWREFGTTTNGVASKELLANNYTFRMTYGFASNDKAQNIGATPTVVFQTVNANVELRNSSGSLIDQGTVQYYSSGWREFGTTANGIVSKELLANNYTFRMTNEYISNDKAQNIGTNSTVTFPTVFCTISVKDLQNQPVNNARASYYSSGWRLIGETINGEITKEFLPANLTFRVNSGSVQLDKTQNLSTSNLVEFNLGQ